ncbi:MAG: hypothetical protein MJZ65_04270 [Paludibacteraceae bacterium]|nr:hypothetical protein [Paludibacteraceae bacterium]
MEQRHLILVDEQSQVDRLKRIHDSLKSEGIELVSAEINPNDFFTRKENGDIEFDAEKMKNKLRSIPFIRHLDIFATDYNLVADELKGIDVIAILYDLIPHYCKQMVIYSAQIETVIDDIINNRASGLNEKERMIKLLSKNDIAYLSSVGEFENKFKQLIVQEKNISIDDRLIDLLYALDNERFRCSIPEFKENKISEIGEKLLNNDSGAIALRKEIAEQILAYITSIQGYE